MELLFLSSHTGTHIDAPYHFVKNGIKIDQISLDRLTGNGILIKIQNPKIRQFHCLILILLRNNLEKSPTIHRFSFIQVGRKISKKKLTFTENPGLNKSAAKYLASKKSILLEQILPV